ncbi:hypothetical protein AB833_09300 [Chromatiales bacterium (ex Bugula neritina AB1)]|nr:hypothetical protein AB833_09300 [Chromatiales bacterium (ex Bugula neritina AB1)]
MEGIAMKTKVLLVEDNVPLALALKIRLSAMGYNLITAENVASAMSMIANRKPDLSLIDINLPDGTGFSLAKQIKNNPNIPEIPVVFISANGNSDYREKSILYSSAPLLEKPFSAAQLIKALEFTQHTTALWRDNSVETRRGH